MYSQTYAYQSDDFMVATANPVVTKAVYTVLKAGIRLENTAYSKTLKLLETKGEAAFYSGPIAKDIVKKVQDTEDNHCDGKRRTVFGGRLSGRLSHHWLRCKNLDRTFGMGNGHSRSDFFA